MTLAVIDASALVALLADAGPAGAWVTAQVNGHHLAAPHLVRYEVANVLRRQEDAGRLSRDQAHLAHADLLDLPIECWPYSTVADRAWELRHNLTSYDASYVALAELLDVPLLTCDGRLTRAPGVGCAVLTPSTPAETWWIPRTEY